MCISRHWGGVWWITISVANVIIQTDCPFNPVAMEIFDLHAEQSDAVVDFDAPVAGSVVEGTHFGGLFRSGR